MPSRLLAISLFLLAIHPAAAEPPAAFSDQTTALGVDFTHHFDFDDRVMPIGAGGAWGDYDGDGDFDLFVADRDGANVLFRNDGSGFIDRAVALGVDLPAANSTGALFGDYDNDGDQDLYVMNRGNNVLFRNDGPGGPGGWIFTDVTGSVGGAAFGRTSAAAWGDYDGDGFLDLYVSNHSYPTTAPAAGDPFRSDFFYHNVEGAGGERILVDVAHDLLDSAILNDSLAHSVAWIDCDNDGDQDLYVVNEGFSFEPTALAANRLWRNDGPGGPSGWIFSDISASSGADVGASPMGVAVGDYNGDGWLDFVISDAGPNRLYQNQGGCVFVEKGVAAGVARNPIPSTSELNVSWGLVWLDADFDGDEDLFVANGRARHTEATAKQPNPYFENQGNPPDNTFAELAPPGHTDDPRSSRTVIKADYDRDGDEDLYVVNFGVAARLLRNDQIGGDHLTLFLVGTESNRDAIGARVRLSIAGEPVQHRVVQSGQTTGGGHSLELVFGVTGHAIVDSVEIDWPSGRHTMLANLPTNQRYVVIEPSAVPSLPIRAWLILAALLLAASRFVLRVPAAFSCGARPAAH